MGVKEIELHYAVCMKYCSNLMMTNSMYLRLKQQFEFTVKDNQELLDAMVIFPHWEEANLTWEEPFFLHEIDVTKVEIETNRNEDEGQTLEGFSLNVFFAISESVVHRIPLKINAISENAAISDLPENLLKLQIEEQLIPQLVKVDSGLPGANRSIEIYNG